MPLIVLGIIVMVGVIALIFDSASSAMKRRKIVVSDVVSTVKSSASSSDGAGKKFGGSEGSNEGFSETATGTADRDDTLDAAHGTEDTDKVIFLFGDGRTKEAPLNDAAKPDDESTKDGDGE